MFKILRYRYTQAGWVAEVKHDGAQSEASIKFMDIPMMQIANIHAAADAVPLPRNPKDGQVVDVDGG